MRWSTPTHTHPHPNSIPHCSNKHDIIYTLDRDQTNGQECKAKGLRYSWVLLFWNIPRDIYGTGKGILKVYFWEILVRGKRLMRICCPTSFMQWALVVAIQMCLTKLPELNKSVHFVQLMNVLFWWFKPTRSFYLWHLKIFLSNHPTHNSCIKWERHCNNKQNYHKQYRLFIFRFSYLLTKHFIRKLSVSHISLATNYHTEPHIRRVFWGFASYFSSS